MSTNVTAIVCPQCGSTDITILSDTFGKCNVCGSSVSVISTNPGEETGSRTVSPDVFEAIYTVKKDISHEEFLRAVMISLGKNPNTPNDICTKLQFGEITETIQDVLVCSAHVEADYSVSIGYDRTEEYWDKEKKKDSNGNEYLVDVKKTRTVTDWKPHNGHISGDAVEVMPNEDPSDKSSLFHDELSSLSSTFKYTIKLAKPESIVREGTAAVSKGALERAKKWCASTVVCHASLPGDHQKDLHYSSAINLTGLVCYKIPVYSVSYTYNGESYKVSGCANGGLTARIDCPPNNIDIQTIIKEKVIEKTAPHKMKCRYSGYANGFFLLLTIVLSIIFGDFGSWFFLPTIATLVLHIVFLCKKTSAIQEFTKQLTEQLTQDNNKLKLEDLQAGLASKGFEPFEAC